MPWSTTRQAGTAAKYRTREHRQLRAALVQQIKDFGSVACTSPACVFDGAPITNPNGLQPDGLNLGHDDDGVTYRGAEHRADNVKDGARRGRARQEVTRLRW